MTENDFCRRCAADGKRTMAYKLHFISLGCAKNTVNCEQMMALCRDAGMELCPSPEGCDAAVVNTCGFLSSANEEAIENILAMAELKKAGKLKKILVTGCMTQRWKRLPTRRRRLRASSRRKRGGSP